MVDPASPPPSPAGPDPAAPPILIVDDQSDIRDLFAAAIEGAGYRTLQAADGQAALDILERQPVSLVLLDCQMPVMNGIQCLTAIRERESLRTLPVIMVTGLAEIGDRVRGLTAGANDYLTKPPAMAELLARVRAHLRDRSYWASLIERDLRDRRAIAAAVGRLRGDAGAEDTAQRMVDQLAAILGIPSVVLFQVTDGGDVIPLAVRGALARLFTPRRPASAEFAGHLLNRVADGPWIECPNGVDGDDDFAHALADAGVRAAAFAPLPHGERSAGLLQVALTTPRSKHPREELVHRLPALIDFAGFAGALLGPQLAAEDQTARARATLQGKIDRAEFLPVFQPIVNIYDFRVVGYEALTRFPDGARPDLRFAEAASLGLGLKLEIACLRAALEASRLLPLDAYVSINVSPALILEHRSLLDLVRESPRDLVLEITEHAAIDDYFMLRAAITDLGPEIEIAVDDAGAGFSSMRHILELHPQLVKLDQGLIHGIHEDPVEQALVAGMAFFGSRTASRMIAEGIEKEKELECLRTLGIPFGQGYLLGRPMPAEESPR